MSIKIPSLSLCGILERKGRPVIAVEAGLQHYLKQINEAPLLTPEEERELGETIQRSIEFDELFGEGKVTLAKKEGAEADAQRARDRMIRSNLRLVVNIAKNYANRGMPLSDLIEEGNLGLLRAVEGFDPDQGTRFSTYGSWWIKQAIKRALINAVQPIHIPAYMVDMIARFKQAQETFIEREGRQPDLKELADEMSIPERKVRIIKRAVKAFSSPTQSGDAETGLPLSEVLADTRTAKPSDAVFTNSENKMLQRLLDQIDPREAEILRLRYGLQEGEPMTLKDIGKKVGLTRERVRQIEHEALRRLNQLVGPNLD
ncbi:MAG: sigma-70 family RNA polymerase sigma factor [Planctomycetes bacterium]|nr:sigma-70 family RNA polymerase sigma factor [Planctomycetota bacterium]